MFAKRNKSMLIILVASILLSPLSLLAQEQKSSAADWSNLKTVPSASKLVVKLKNGKSITGKLNNVSGSALSLATKEKSVDVKREDILSVYQSTKRSATKATLIGLAAGAGTGAVIGVAGSKDDQFAKIDHVATAALTVIGAAGGALTGYLIGKSGGKKILIYQAH